MSYTTSKGTSNSTSMSLSRPSCPLPTTPAPTLGMRVKLSEIAHRGGLHVVGLDISDGLDEKGLHSPDGYATIRRKTRT